MTKDCTDSREGALTYLAAFSHDMIPPVIAEALVKAGPEMIEFLEACATVAFYSIPDFPDYHTESPGAKREDGRTLECPPFPFGKLGAWNDRVQVSLCWPDYNMTVGEPTLGQPVLIEVDPAVEARRIVHDERGLRQAMIGRLLRACLDCGIKPKTDSRAVELVMSEGAVMGVRLEGIDEPFTVSAPNVVIATGGLEWDNSLVRAFTRGPLTRPVSVPTNTGDGLCMAIRVGAMPGNMRETLCIPVIKVPIDVNAAGQQLFAHERYMPGRMMVNKMEGRFTDEESKYNAFGAVFKEQDVSAFEYADLQCWKVSNPTFFEKYPFVGGLGNSFQIGERPAQWIASADTLTALAHRVGMDPDRLEASVAPVNDNALEGKDPDFHRGKAANDICSGDPTFRGDARAILGPIKGGPYYTIEVKSGALSTQGEAQTNARSCLLTSMA